jgi:hypothetical protein
MNRPKRRVRLDLTRVAYGLDSFSAPTEQDMALANEATRLINWLHLGEGYWEDGNGLDAHSIAQIPDEVFDAAHAIMEGGMNQPHLRAATEAVDEEAFGNLVRSLLQKTPMLPDTGKGDEFV